MYCLTPLALGGTTRVFTGTRAGAAKPGIVVKVLREPYCREPRMRHRFARECEILAKLDHPGLPSLIAAEPARTSGLLLIYRYVPGPTLAEHLRVSALCTAERVDLADRLLDNLSSVLIHLHRHPARIAHGDIAPRNIVLGDDGTVTLIDLGTARTTLELPHDDDLFAIAQPAYLSPEQAQGRNWATASDLYQLGLMLFEVLTGRRYNPGQALRDCRLHAAGATGADRWVQEEINDPDRAGLIAALLEPEPRMRLSLRELESH